MEIIIGIVALAVIGYFVFRKPKTVEEVVESVPYKVETPAVEEVKVAEKKPTVKKASTRKPKAPAAKKPAAKKTTAKSKKA